LGYKTAHSIVDLSRYGIPQNRKRYILVAVLNGSPQAFFSILRDNNDSFCVSKGISNITTTMDALSDLEKIHGICPSPDTKGFMAGIYGPIRSGYQRLMRKDVLATEDAVDSHRFVKHRKETIILHENLLTEAPIGKRITPEDDVVDGLNRRGVTVLDAKSQAPTITSIPDELVHYREPRILTVREQARIQGFPDWFEFKGKYTSGGKRRTQEVPRYTQVGNAVPPLFAEQMGLALFEVLKNE
jgi:DNA (cytosine-5)-methyltransferase 1